MRRNFFILVLAIIAILVYIILINFIANMPSFGQVTTGNSVGTIEGGDIKIGFGDKVEVTVTRNRWYGKIIENSYPKGKTATLYLFNFITLPLNAKGKSFFLIHTIFLVFLVFFLYFTNKKMKQKDFERGFA